MSTINICRGYLVKDKTSKLCAEKDNTNLFEMKDHVHFILCDRIITYEQQKGGREKGRERGRQTYFCVVTAGMKDVLQEIKIERFNKECDKSCPC